MQFLADESLDFTFARALQSAGHDVTSVAPNLSGAKDGVVASLAYFENRVLLTEDRDFGRLVFAGSYPTAGVIYLRYALAARSQLIDQVIALVETRGDALHGLFVVMQPGRARLGRLPGL